jgi:hypothetical protein
VTTYTAQDVAAWMKLVFDDAGELERLQVVRACEQEFGEQFIYTNANGHPAIDRKVLIAFRKLTPGIVFRHARDYWDERASTDAPGRRQP